MQPFAGCPEHHRVWLAQFMCSPLRSNVYPPPYFRLHTIIKSLFQSLTSTMLVFSFICLFVDFIVYLDIPASKYRNKVLKCFKCKRFVMCSMEKIHVLDKQFFLS